MSGPARLPGESLSEFALRRAKALKIEIAPPIRPEPAAAPTTPRREWDADLIPDPSVTLDQERIAIDRVLADIDILDAYRRWCGKMEPKLGKKRESIMVSCPNPAHPDKNPSAWLNLDKGDGGVGNCATCGGFDKYDIAAWHFGFPVPGYKDKSEFPELRERMAESLGYRVMTSGKERWLEDEEAPAGIAEASTTQATTEAQEAGAASGREEEDVQGDVGTAPASVISLEEPIDIDAPLEDPPIGFDWRDFPLREDSFLHRWLTATSRSFEPEEYYFWLGLMALGAAVGNDVKLDERSGVVRLNLMTCLVGPSGMGKSIAISQLVKLLMAALPFDPETAAGVRLISSPGSGEALVDQFNYEVKDVNTNQTTALPVNGLYKENELASMVKRAGRSGNTVREILMDMLDFETPISTSSRGHGTVTAKHHFMQMVTGTQPGMIGNLLTAEDNSAGYLNRWVFAFGTPKIRPPFGGDAIDFTPSIEALKAVRGWTARPRAIAWADPIANALFGDFYLDELQPLTMRDGDDMVARMPLLAKKIVALLAVNDKSTTIMEEHAKIAMELYPYLMQCYRTVEGKVAHGGDKLEAAIDAVMKYMGHRRNQSFTLREIIKQSGARRFPKDTVRKAIDSLKAMGWIEELPRPKSDKVPRFQFIDDDQPAHIATVSHLRSV